MPSYEQSTEVHAKADALFAYLSDIGNLPNYMESMTSAESAGGEKIRTTAEVDVDHNGTTEKVEGEAWFRVDDAAKSLSWGSEGPNDYHGELEVTGVGDTSTVSVTIHTEHDEEGNDIVEGLKGTLANIKRLVEAA